MLALLDGRPILQHVLDAARRAGLDPVVVVLGEEAGGIEAVMAWAGEHRVRNPTPAAGLASSLRVGIDAVADLAPPVDAVVVLLGDQPMTAPGVIGALVAAAAEPSGRSSTFVMPEYAGGGGPNPVLVRRGGFAMAQATSGDRGLGPMIAANPKLVTRVAVAGQNPDIDTPEDLARARRSRQAPAADSRPTAGLD